MTLRKAMFIQGTDAAKYKLPAEDGRLDLGGLLTPGASGMLSRGGVFPSSTSGALVTATATGVRVTAFRAAVPGSQSLTQGVYLVASDAVENRAFPAPSATTYQRALIVARVYDVLSGSDHDGWDIEVVKGAPAATAGQAALPPLPANSLELRRALVDPNGAVTLTGSSQLTVPVGGILPVAADETQAGVFIGQYRDHPTRGLERWDGARWKQWGHGSLSALLTWQASATMPSSALWGPGPVTSAVQGSGNGGLVIGASGQSDRFLVPAVGLYLVTHRFQLTSAGVSFGPRSFIDLISAETYRYAVGGPGEGIASITGLIAVNNPASPIQLSYYFGLSGGSVTDHFSSTRVVRVSDYV